jgi:hypothetical protein
MSRPAPAPASASPAPTPPDPPSSTGDRRWPVRFLATYAFGSVEGVVQEGSLLLRRDVARLVLLDHEGVVIDARCLLEGEEVHAGIVVVLPAHEVWIATDSTRSTRVESGATRVDRARSNGGRSGPGSPPAT